MSLNRFHIAAAFGQPTFKILELLFNNEKITTEEKKAALDFLITVYLIDEGAAKFNEIKRFLTGSRAAAHEEDEHEEDDDEYEDENEPEDNDDEIQASMSAEQIIEVTSHRLKDPVLKVVIDFALNNLWKSCGKSRISQAIKPEDYYKIFFLIKLSILKFIQTHASNLEVEYVTPQMLRNLQALCMLNYVTANMTDMQTRWLMVEENIFTLELRTTVKSLETCSREDLRALFDLYGQSLAFDLYSLIDKTDNHFLTSGRYREEHQTYLSTEYIVELREDAYSAIFDSERQFKDNEAAIKLYEIARYENMRNIKYKKLPPILNLLNNICESVHVDIEVDKDHANNIRIKGLKVETLEILLAADCQSKLETIYRPPGKQWNHIIPLQYCLLLNEDEALFIKNNPQLLEGLCYQIELQKSSTKKTPSLFPTVPSFLLTVEINDLTHLRRLDQLNPRYPLIPMFHIARITGVGIIGIKQARLQPLYVLYFSPHVIEQSRQAYMQAVSDAGFDCRFLPDGGFYVNAQPYSARKEQPKKEEHKEVWDKISSSDAMRIANKLAVPPILKKPELFKILLKDLYVLSGIKLQDTTINDFCDVCNNEIAQLSEKPTKETMIRVMLHARTDKIKGGYADHGKEKEKEKDNSSDNILTGEFETLTLEEDPPRSRFAI